MVTPVIWSPENNGVYVVKISEIGDQQVNLDGELYRDGELSKTAIVFANAVEGADCVKITSGSGTESDPYVLELAIAKTDATITKAPEAKTLTYTGSAQELVEAGTATGGEMQYALGSATEATGPYTAAIPTATDAGT